MRTVIAGAVAARRSETPSTNVTYDSGNYIVEFEPSGDQTTPSFTIASQSNRMLIAGQGTVDFTAPTLSTDVRQGSSGGTAMTALIATQTGTGNAGRMWSLANPTTGSTVIWQGANTKLINALQGLAYYNVERVGDVQAAHKAEGGVTSSFIEVTLSTPNPGSLVVMYAWLTGSNASSGVTITTPAGDPGYSNRGGADVPGLDICAFYAFDRVRQGATTTVRVESSSFDNDYDFNIIAAVLEPTGAP